MEVMVAHFGEAYHSENILKLFFLLLNEREES